MNKTNKTLGTLLGTAFLTAAFSAPVMADANPFASAELSQGYQLADKHEGKCGEGKCGEKGESEGKCGEGKCGEKGKGEGKCGEGKCGEKSESEVKCGEGKCGGKS